MLNKGFASSSVITELKSIFSRHGIPIILISDNGPPFNSAEFKEFCKEWDVQHVFSSPHFPRSNVMVERVNGTLKKIFYKSLQAKQDLYIALLQYRNTCIDGLASPAQLLMSRSLRSKLPICNKLLEPKIVNSDEYLSVMINKQDKMSCYFNKNTVDLKPLNKGDKIVFKQLPHDVWLQGEVVDIGPTNRSYIVSNGSKSYRHNRELIKPFVPTVSNPIQSPDGNNKVDVRRSRRVIRPPKILDL